MRSKIISCIVGCLVVAGLHGCAVQKDIVTVKDRDVVTITVPDRLLEKCHITSPPDEETYVNATWEEKENTLTTYTILLLEDLATCNNQITAIKETLETQKELTKD